MACNPLGDLILWNLWGRVPDGGSRREFFPSANTSKNRPFPGLYLKGNDDR